MAAAEPDIRVFEDLGALSEAAATELAGASKDAVSLRGRFLVVLSGGGTPASLYGLLSRPTYRDEIPWGSVHLFWGDERCVPPDDPESNFGQAWDAFLHEVPVPPENIHRIHGEMDPVKAASDYELVLKGYAAPPLDWPRFDLVLLGLGEDGHTASLFPGSTVEAASPVEAVTGQYQDRPSQRVTLTPLVFNLARKVMFLAAGASKARIVAEVLGGQQRPDRIPAQRIRPVDGTVMWLLDRGAAGALTNIRFKE